MNNNAFYFNGETSKKHNATLELKSESIHINFFDGTSHQTKIWYKTDIHTPELTSGEVVSLKYGKEFPYQSIELKQSDFTKELLNKYELNKKSSKYSFITENGLKGIVAGIIIFISVFFTFYKYIIPSIAEGTAAAIPIKYEQSFGVQIKNSLLVNDSIDVKKTESLKSFFNKLKFETPYELDLTVVHSSIQNAFAIPGGHIVVYTGIMDNMECPEELAALLGHELVHVNHRHGTKSIFRNLANAIILSILLNDVNGITAVLVDNANSLDKLSFSRHLEKEADEEALEMMFQNNINPYGMIHLLEQLNELSEGINIPQILSSHPITTQRLSYINKVIEEKSNYNIDEPDWEEEWIVLTEKKEYKKSLIDDIFETE